MAADQTVTQGDTRPPLLAVLGDEFGPVALFGATVTVRVVALGGGAVMLNARPCTVDADQNANRGLVTYLWQPGETSVVPGLYLCQWTVVGPGGLGPWHFPNGDRFTLEVTAPL
jgi:hypothetical protein